VNSFEELNELLNHACVQDAHRRTRGQQETVARMWEAERNRLLPLPVRDYPACATRIVKANGYLQVDFDANRYSVPYQYRDKQIVLRAFPFKIELLHLDKVIACHPRCFQKEQDILDPWHYLPLLEQRPGAFEHAKPMRRLREQWPVCYEQLLAILRQDKPQGGGVREFLEILKLHQQYPPKMVEQAVEKALALGAAHLDGIRLCLRQLLEPQALPQSLDLSLHPRLVKVGSQPIELGQYNRLLEAR